MDHRYDSAFDKSVNRLISKCQYDENEACVVALTMFLTRTQVFASLIADDPEANQSLPAKLVTTDIRLGNCGDSLVQIELLSP